MIEVPEELLARCVDWMQWAGEYVYRQSGGRGHGGTRAESMLVDAAKLAEYAGTQEPEEPEADDTMPPGYEREHTGGGYYEVTDPEGNVVEGPSNGRFQGKDGAADGAWAHHRSP